MTETVKKRKTLTLKRSKQEPKLTKRQRKNRKCKLSKEARKRIAKQARQLLHRLSTKYPKTFDRKNKVPLEIGIHKSIKNEFNAPSRVVNRMLFSWTNKSRYQQALRSENAMRHNLQGVPVEAVNQEALGKWKRK